MVLLTIIGRSADGLPLSASVNADDLRDKLNINEYQSQGKLILKKTGQSSEPQLTIETGPYFFHILIEKGISYVCLCERAFSKRLAFAYLEDLATEFQQKYSNLVYSESRPYRFMDFELYMKAASKKLNAAKSRKNITLLSNELQDVQKIMVQNIDDVLQRGVAISDLDSKASNLSLMSQNYRKNASLLNSKATFAKVVAGSVLLICFVLYFWVL